MKIQILVFLAAILSVFALMQTSVFASTGNLDADILSVEIKGISLTGGRNTTIAGFAQEVVPVRVIFRANDDASDARVKAWIGGYKEEIRESTRRMNLVNDSVYSEILSLKLPSDIEPQESYTLYVRIETKTDYKEEEFSFEIQRESYNLKILDVDAEKTVKAGENLAVDVVLKNIGYEALDDLFVLVSIPKLNVENREYFKDLIPEDGWWNDKEDSREKRVNLKIPMDAKSGVYELKVEAYNSDSRDVVTRSIAVLGEDESRVVVPVASKEIQKGAVVSYELVIINSGKSAKEYEIIPEVNEGVIASISDAVITIPAGSTKTIEVKAKGVKEGRYSFAVDVNSAGELVKKVNLTAVVTEKKLLTGNIVILTIVLAIVFIVLLVVLIVLLTRKPKTEELEESYY